MSKNPFEVMKKFYEKSIKEQDKKGFAEVYKKATELLFERLKKDTNIDLHFEDVNFGDGYFLRVMGTNSVVHFHVKEAPGWLFGIWWSPIATEETANKKKQEYKTDRLDCEFFFQFEEEIDKFKPSASVFGDHFDFVFAEEDYYSGNWMKAYQDLEFVIKEPYLAFYKDIHYTDFNHEYVSRESAKRYWDRYWKEKAKTKETDRTNARAMYETLKFIISPMVKDGDAFIYDRGENISPRYEVFIRNGKLADGKPLVNKEGCYWLFGFDWEDKKSDEKLWKKTIKECAKREGYKTFYENPFSETCIIRNTRAFNRLKNTAFQEGSLLYGKLADGTIYEGEVKSRWDD